MTKAREQIEGLKALHGTPADKIKALLAEAAELNEQARQNRIQAGRLLLELRSGGGNWRRGTGCSPALAEHLISMANNEVDKR